MTANTSRFDRLTVWILIAVCILAIPVGILFTWMSKTTADSDNFASSINDRLVVLKLSGMIVESEDESFLSAMNTVDTVKRRLRKALKDKKVKGILLRIDSPGGTVATSQEIHDYIKAVRDKGIPVVASMSDVAASGGYYVACACDKIFAMPGTLTGSIGVIMNSFNAEGLEQKLGIRPQTIKSGQFKDIGSFNRAMTPEEREILQNLIGDSYDQFLDAVAKGRKMDKETVRKYADGRVYSGRQAIKIGLVDSLGGYETALASLQTLSKDKFGHKDDLKVEEGGKRSTLAQLMELLSQGSPLSPLVDSLVPAPLNARFYKMPLWLMQ